MAFDVLISYSSHDKPIADAACAALEAADIRCWIAPRDISPGRDYGEFIIEAIETAKVLALIFSHHANASQQIKREVERAVSKGLPVIPVRIENVMPSRTLEYFISSPHWLDAFPPPRERYFAKLIESVRTLLDGERPATSGSATSVIPPAKKLSRRSLTIAAGLAVLALVAGGVAFYRVQSGVLVRTLTGHGVDANSIAFSPDGKVLAAGGWDGLIYFWSLDDGRRQTAAIPGFTGTAAPFSPDGKWIADGTDADVTVWDATTKRVLKTFSGHSNKVQTVSFSPDGKSLASGATDHLVFIWDVAGSQPGRRFEGHTDQVNSVAFSPDGKRLASGSFDKKVIVWDIAGGVAAKTLTGTGKVNAAMFSPDGAWLAAAGVDGDVTVWDTGDWRVARVMPGNGQTVNAIAFSPNSKLLLSAAMDGGVKAWSTLTGALLHTYAGHVGAVWAVGFSATGERFASAGSDKTVKIWKAPRSD